MILTNCMVQGGRSHFGSESRGHPQSGSHQGYPKRWREGLSQSEPSVRQRLFNPF